MRVSETQDIITNGGHCKYCLVLTELKMDKNIGDLVIPELYEREPIFGAALYNTGTTDMAIAFRQRVDNLFGALFVEVGRSQYNMLDVVFVQ